ncbi:MAG: MOSC domain-containing protein [Candidatus Phosphoribacter sp.]
MSPSTKPTELGSAMTPELPAVAVLVAVNVGRPRPDGEGGVTGIHKSPVGSPVTVRDPGSRSDGLGSGLTGDHVADRRHHGGTDQAVYAVAREELDHWATEVGRDLAAGSFGENLTTEGLDVDGALVGEIWRVGETVRLQVTGPRIPCATFARAMGEQRWVKRFTERGRTGAYLRVLTAGQIRAGDPITIESRPAHDITVPLMFRALTTERALMPRLAEIDDLGLEGERELARWRAAQGPRLPS